MNVESDELTQNDLTSVKWGKWDKEYWDEPEEMH